MPDHPLLLSAAMFLVIGTLYSSVGHAGSSGYLALMAFLDIHAGAMRPAALVLNILVAAIAFSQFYRAGHFAWRLFWPFSVASIPTAYLGGTIGLAPAAFNIGLGAVLLLTAGRMAATASTATDSQKPTCPPQVPVAILAGAAIGFLAGLTGTGGGVFLGPLILLLGWADPKQTAGASALFSLGNSIAGVASAAGHPWELPSQLPAWIIAAAAGGLLGSTYGSRVAPYRTLRVLLSIVLASAGAKLVLK